MGTNIQQIIQDLIIPEFRTLSSEIRRLDDKIDTGFKRLDDKIDTGLEKLDNKIDTGLERLDEKVDSLKENVRNLREEFRLAIDIHERLAALEAKINR